MAEVYNNELCGSWCLRISTDILEIDRALSNISEG